MKIKYFNIRSSFNTAGFIRSLLSALLVFLFVFKAEAQCPVGGVIFSSQAKIDSFIIKYPTCTTITGDMIIWTGNDISNFYGLSNLTTITGQLRIETTTFLQNLDGLNNLTTVGDLIEFYENLNLVNIDALSNLTSVGYYIYFEENPKLANLDGLSGLTHLDDDMLIRDCPLLTNIDGLSNLTHVGNFDIWNAPLLTNVDGLRNLTSTSGSLSFINNSSLTNVDSLNNLTSIGGSLNFQKNPNLTHLPAFSNLSYIGGSLSIENPSAITSIDGFNNLTHLGGLKIEGPTNPISHISGMSNLSVINGDVILYSLDTLTNINGLSNINYISGELKMSNIKLSNLDDFSNLDSVGGDLTIRGFHNSGLTNVNGLSNLTKIGGQLTIAFNNTLTNVNDLSNLTKIDGTLEIGYNNVLTSLSGLQNIDPETIGHLRIQNNANLSLCNLPNICVYLDNPAHSTEISGNSTSCLNRNAVIVACSPLSIHLGNITATNQGSQHLIAWNTLAEDPGDYFVLERSKDGSSFEALANIAANGIASDYQYVDTKPYEGISYYRLMMSDRVQEFYSPIVSASLKKNNDITVIPNPTDGKITLHIGGGQGAQAKISVMDITGRVLQTIEGVQSTDIEISLSGYAQGSYLVIYQDEQRSQTIKVQKR